MTFPCPRASMTSSLPNSTRTAQGRFHTRSTFSTCSATLSDARQTHSGTFLFAATPLATAPSVSSCVSTQLATSCHVRPHAMPLARADKLEFRRAVMRLYGDEHAMELLAHQHVVDEMFDVSCRRQRMWACGTAAHACAVPAPALRAWCIGSRCGAVVTVPCSLRQRHTTLLLPVPHLNPTTETPTPRH